MTAAAHTCEVAPAPGLPVLDRRELDANTLGDPALQKELFELYFGHAVQALERMEKALQEEDPVNWSASAHGIKGTARTLGLLRLGEIAAEAEAAGKHGAKALTRPRLNALRHALTSATIAAHGHLALVLKPAQRIFEEPLIAER